MKVLKRAKFGNEGVEKEQNLEMKVLKRAKFGNESVEKSKIWK
jgi:hypothetical protein